MEPEMVEFLKKISKSILIAVVWLGITSIAAIKGDNAFIEGDIRLGNVLFYCWFIISVVLVIKLLKKVWKSDTGNDGI
jgi:hypothetical protein